MYRVKVNRRRHRDFDCFSLHKLYNQNREIAPSDCKLCDMTYSGRAEGDCVGRLVRTGTGPQGGTAGLVVGIRVSIRTIILEIRIILNAAGGASGRRIVRPGATISAVRRISIEISGTSGFTTDNVSIIVIDYEPTVGARAVQVEMAFRLRTTDVIGDLHGKIATVNVTDVIPVCTACSKVEFG